MSDFKGIYGCLIKINDSTNFRCSALYSFTIIYQNKDSSSPLIILITGAGNEGPRRFYNLTVCSPARLFVKSSRTFVSAVVITFVIFPVASSKLSELLGLGLRVL